MESLSIGLRSELPEPQGARDGAPGRDAPPRHRHGVRSILDPIRMHIEYQDSMITAVSDEQPLINLIHRQLG